MSTPTPPHRSWFAVWRWKWWVWMALVLVLPVVYFLAAAPLLTLAYELPLAYRSDAIDCIHCFFQPAGWLAQNVETLGAVWAWEVEKTYQYIDCWNSLADEMR